MKILQQLKSDDNALKCLIGLDDGNSVEALYMHDQDRALTYHSTVCVSSQIGCKMNCRFCATGSQGFARNLTAKEIAGQVTLLNKHRRAGGYPPLDAVVFAGMGEPLDNYVNVLLAMALIRDRLGIKHFELATVGVVPRIANLTDDVYALGVKLRLNVSLHAVTDDARTQLIPATSAWGVDEIVAAADDFARRTETTARIRYMLIRGLNDSAEDAEALVRLLGGKKIKLVISAYNDNNISGLHAPDDLEVLEFCNKIKGRIDCDIFHNFGAGVLGGCGQLRRNRHVS